MRTFQEAFSLKGERALVTGGGSGLGLAMTRCFLQAGAEVIIVGRKPKEEMAELCADLGDRVYYRQFDVANTEQSEELIDELESRIGPISILVHNAGNHCKKPVEQTTDEDFMSLINVHIMGAFALSRAVIPRMKQRGKGSILFQASMTSFIGMPNVIAYSCVKSGYLGMVRTLATETAGYGIRVNGIAPGWIETPLLHQALSGDEERSRKIISRTPMARFGKPEDIGWASVYLSSDAASFVNGIILPVDGGALIGF